MNCACLFGEFADCARDRLPSRDTSLITPAQFVSNRSKALCLSLGRTYLVSIYLSRQFSNETNPFTPIETTANTSIHQTLSCSRSSRRPSAGGMGPVSRPAGAPYEIVYEHKHRLCLYCDFQWMPPDTVSDHLEKCHPDVDPDVILHQADSTLRLCMYCDVEWNHTYQYKDHLREHHPNVDPDAVLGEAPWSQRRDKIIARFTTAAATLTRRRTGRRQA
jgi:hypothetical protein